MPSNDSRDSKATAPATWGLIFGLLTSSACGTASQVDHTQRPLCDDPSGATIDPCAESACFGYSGIDLPDGGRCVVPGSTGGTGTTVDGGPDAKRYACGFCNG